jgi:hypothetical protein
LSMAEFRDNYIDEYYSQLVTTVHRG